jgi:hypothetical protein
MTTELREPQQIKLWVNAKIRQCTTRHSGFGHNTSAKERTAWQTRPLTQTI